MAGGNGGKAYVYNTRTKAKVADYTFGDPQTSFVNDVVVTPYGAWFTDSYHPRLFFVPNVLGSPRTLQLSGPGAGGAPGDFFMNDIIATPAGDTLLVAATTPGKVFTINPITGATKEIAGVNAPSVVSLVLEGRRLWATKSSWSAREDSAGLGLVPVVAVREAQPQVRRPLESAGAGQPKPGVRAAVADGVALVEVRGEDLLG